MEQSLVRCVYESGFPEDSQEPLTEMCELTETLDHTSDFVLT